MFYKKQLHQVHYYGIFMSTFYFCNKPRSDNRMCSVLFPHDNINEDQ